MNDKEIIEGNRLIAEFMGGISFINGYDFSVRPLENVLQRIYHLDDLKYHTSWDWLMPVWKKMVDFNLKETSDMCIREPWGYMQKVRNALSDGEIIPVWKSVTKFITWYNSLTPKPNNQ